MKSFDEICELLAIIPPKDIEAEQAVLGAILKEPDLDVLSAVQEHLQGGEFFNIAHGRIFRAMLKIRKKENPIDLVSVTAALQESKELEQVGGVSYLSDLAHASPTAANVDFYAKQVSDMFVSRQAIITSFEVLKTAASHGDIQEFVAMAEAAMSKLSDQAAPAKEFRIMKDVLMEVFEQAETKYKNRDTFRGVTGIPSGYPDLDIMTSGFQKQDLIIVAARPSVGKTAFALNIAQNVGTTTDETIAIFSLEMSDAQLVQRMMSAEGNIDAGRMRTGFYEGDDWEKMTLAVGNLYEAKIYIDDTPGITVSEIRSKCRRLKKSQGLGLVIIDYLQLIGSPRRNGVNRQQEVSEISRMLKQIARELDVSVIALSQLSRAVEQRQDKRPMMSDLRESGSIEQDADIVAFLYRDDYYNQESKKKNIIEIIIAKQRNGPVGTVDLVFLKNYNKFTSLDRTHQEPQQGTIFDEDDGKDRDYRYGKR